VKIYIGEYVLTYLIVTLWIAMKDISQTDYINGIMSMQNTNLLMDDSSGERLS
jgi:hypothetical protein